MIKANELRIGNWIYYNGKLSKIDLTDFRDILEDNYEINYYKPIELTEEILLKSKLKPTSEDFFGIKISKKGFLEINLKPKRTIIFFDGVYFIELKNIKYLNQLQNLYFALTGKELEINL